MSDSTTPLEATREALRGFLGPVEAERDKHRARVEELEAELAAEREALRLVEGVLRRLNGSKGAKPGPKGNAQGPNGRHGRTFPKAEKDTAYVRGWLEAHATELEDAWTGADVIRLMRAQGNTTLGKDKVRHSLDLLHERGYLTLNRLGPGGGKVYALTGGAG